MSRPTRTTPTRADEATPRYGRTALYGFGLAAFVAIGLALATGSEDTTSASDRTAEFAASGTAFAADLLVDGAEIAMGNVPLNVTVSPTWTITNTGADTVTLGKPHASVIEGCCPGPLLLADTTLPPGASTTLTFPLQMHAGMDGPHDFDIHIPVSDDPNVVLTLGVTGHFGA